MDKMARSRLPFRVGIFHTEGNAANMPSLVGAIELLAEEGYYVDLFHRESAKYREPVFNNCLVSVVFLRDHKQRKGLQRWIPGRVIEMLSIAGRHFTQPYIGMIGVDPGGLLLASKYARRFKLPTIYWSMEILHSTNLTSEGQRKLKTLEKRLSQEAALVLVQDKKRADLLVKDNRIEPSRVVLVPNAPKGTARRRKSNYLYHMLDIPTDHRIALHIGPLDDWRMSQELVDSVQNWPANWVLVMHIGVKYHRHQDYVRAVMDSTDPKRVVFSKNPVPRAQLGELIDSADVGVALYKSHPNLNQHLIGLSSGKLLEYLSKGLPVIVGPRHRAFLDGRACGIVVSTPDEIGDALRRIQTDYDAYSSNACTLFNQELRLDLNFQPVIDWISGEAQRRQSTGYCTSVCPRDVYVSCKEK
jgi:glycosyltransferase involved in cell wall biosynthesis